MSLLIDFCSFSFSVVQAKEPTFKAKKEAPEGAPHTRILLLGLLTGQLCSGSHDCVRFRHLFLVHVVGDKAIENSLIKSCCSIWCRLRFIDVAVGICIVNLALRSLSRIKLCLFLPYSKLLGIAVSDYLGPGVCLGIGQLVSIGLLARIHRINIVSISGLCLLLGLCLLFAEQLGHSRVLYEGAEEPKCKVGSADNAGNPMHLASQHQNEQNGSGDEHKNLELLCLGTGCGGRGGCTSILLHENTPFRLSPFDYFLYRYPSKKQNTFHFSEQLAQGRTQCNVQQAERYQYI